MDIRLLSRIAWEWGVRCFGEEHMRDPQVRALRAAEEMIELNQCQDVPKEKLHLLIDTVYARPRGTIEQEFGGTMLTLMVLAWNLGLKLEVCAEHEVLRCLSKSPEHFAERNKEKIQLGLD